MENMIFCGFWKKMKKISFSIFCFFIMGDNMILDDFHFLERGSHDFWKKVGKV